VIDEIIIDSEFESKIPPLTDEEFEQLEANILEEGAVIHPLILWNGILVDGHNRYHIVERYPQIKYTTYDKHFDDRFAAIAWICRNQLGRRNLTPEQKKYLIGKQYEAEKATHGGERHIEHDDHGRFTSSSQNGNLRSKEKTCERIARENGISKNTVIRAEQFSKAVDIAEEAVPGIRQEILSGDIKPTERELSAIARASPEERSELVDQLREPKRPSRKKAPEIQKIEEISEKMLSQQGDGGIEAMIYELDDALDSLMFRWSLCFESYCQYLSDAQCRASIMELIRKGLEYFEKTKGGLIDND